MSDSAGRGLTGPSVSLARWSLGAGPEGHMVLLHHVCRVQIDAPDTAVELHALVNMHVCPKMTPARVMSGNSADD